MHQDKISSENMVQWKKCIIFWSGKTGLIQMQKKNFIFKIFQKWQALGVTKFGGCLQWSKSITRSILSRIPSIALRQNFIWKNGRAEKVHNFLRWKNRFNSDTEKNIFFQEFSKMTSAWGHKVWWLFTIIVKYFPLNFWPNSVECTKTKFHLKIWYSGKSA